MGIAETLESKPENKGSYCNECLEQARLCFLMHVSCNSDIHIYKADSILPFQTREVAIRKVRKSNQEHTAGIQIGLRF